jgi:hypothetical protein
MRLDARERQVSWRAQRTIPRAQGIEARDRASCHHPTGPFVVTQDEWSIVTGNQRRALELALLQGSLQRYTRPVIIPADEHAVLQLQVHNVCLTSSYQLS